MTKVWLIGLTLLIAPAVWYLTQGGISEPIKFFGFLVLIMWVSLYTVFYTAFPRSRNSAWTTQLQFVNLWILCLLVVAITGWFTSPFVFLVYLLVITSYFVLSPLATFGMAVTLVVVYLLRVQHLPVMGDYLTLISLVLTWPIAYYLKHEYLKIGSAENGILILENSQPSQPGILPKVLANRVTNFSTLLRQPIVNIKNYTHVAGNHSLDPETRLAYLQKIFDSATVALRELTKFEEETTGHKMRPAPVEDHK